MQTGEKIKEKLNFFKSFIQDQGNRKKKVCQARKNKRM